MYLFTYKYVLLDMHQIPKVRTCKTHILACLFCKSLLQVSFSGLFCRFLLLVSFADLLGFVYVFFFDPFVVPQRVGYRELYPPPPDASDVPIDTVELARMRLARLEQAAPQSEAPLGEKHVGAGGTDGLDSVMQVT